MFKLVLGKVEEPEIKLPTSAGSWKKPELQKSIYFCFIDFAKALDCVDHNKLWKILKEMGIPDHLTYLLLFCFFNIKDILFYPKKVTKISLETIFLIVYSVSILVSLPGGERVSQTQPLEGYSNLL